MESYPIEWNLRPRAGEGFGAYPTRPFLDLDQSAGILSLLRTTLRTCLNTKFRPCIVLLLFLAFTRPLKAYDYNGKWGVDVFGGLDTLAMGDVNNTLSHHGGSLNSGWEAGLDLNYGLSSNWLINLGLSEIFDQDTFNGGVISLPALSFLAGGEYVILPNVFKGFDLGILGGLEYDMLDGNTSIDPAVFNAGNGYQGSGLRSSARRQVSWSGPPVSGGGSVPTGTAPSGDTYVVTNCVGQTVGGQLSLKLKYFVTENTALALQAGYRYSHIYGVIGTQNGVSGPEGETVDYSGLISRLSATYYF
jgi:hypothetical protein